MTPDRLGLTRDQILAFRRRVAALDQRLPKGTRSLRTAGWAGFQDSMPRAAVLSMHARVQGIAPESWQDRSLVQVWGPRFSVYVVPRRDLAVFTVGRLPDSAGDRDKAYDLAARLRSLIGEERILHGAAERALGIGSNQLRYAAPTGTVLMHWDGTRHPHVWSVPAPATEPAKARLELARRYLHVFGPSTPDYFAAWAGIGRTEGHAAFAGLGRSLLAVTTPIGDRVMLASDEEAMRSAPEPAAGARLLPSGDAYTLLKGDDRVLLVPKEAHRESLWTPRVWPGAVLVGGEVVGTWRRANDRMTIAPWRRLTRDERSAVETEAHSLPLPGVAGALRITWEG
jgi:hypothetical protein